MSDVTRRTFVSAVGASSLALGFGYAKRSQAGETGPALPVSAEALACIESCTRCYNYCMATIGRLLQAQAPAALIRLHFNCAELCRLCADFSLTASEFDGEVAKLCAQICERCAEADEAAGEHDCATVCRECAAACRGA